MSQRPRTAGRPRPLLFEQERSPAATWQCGGACAGDEVAQLLKLLSFHLKFLCEPRWARSLSGPPAGPAAPASPTGQSGTPLPPGPALGPGVPWGTGHQGTEGQLALARLLEGAEECPAGRVRAGAGLPPLSTICSNHGGWRGLWTVGPHTKHHASSSSMWGGVSWALWRVVV